jgi:sugar fermentation stimulation protein A
MEISPMRLLLATPPLEPAVFVERLNRFVVKVRRGSRDTLAHLPNPGRLGEILLPGVTVLLERRRDTPLGWKAAAATWTARWPGDRPRTVYLDTIGINRLAEALLEARLIPELARYEIDGREVVKGASRFDFLLRRGDRRYLLEVKSVTLVEQGLALFPDAQTLRGRRHLLELARWAVGPTRRSGVLFLVQGAAAEFLPDFHNDLEFGRTFRAVRRRVRFLPYRIAPQLDEQGRLVFCNRPQRLAIPWRLLDAGVRDAGLYLAVLELAGDARLEVGSLGPRTFRRGYYVYTGSARRGLSRRIARHLRRRKRLRWHIDALAALSTRRRVLPIRAASRECDLAAEVARVADTQIPDFGASDCGCPGHLAWFRDPPWRLAAFQALLTRFRHRPTRC